jgi:hypothetical protein
MTTSARCLGDNGRRVADTGYFLLNGQSSMVQMSWFGVVH